MRAGEEHAMAERERLTLYLLGALDDAERETFEDHLAGCWHCLDEAAAIGPGIGGLAGLGEADWSPSDQASLPEAPVTDKSTLASPATEEPTSAPPTVEDAELSAAAAAPADAHDTAYAGSGTAGDGAERTPGASGVIDTRRRDRGEARAVAVRPCGNRPTGRGSAGARPPSTVGSRRRRRALWAGAMAVVLVLVGGVMTVNERAAGPDRVLTASGEAPGYGASLSVAITVGAAESATIRITVTGLRQGTRYRLFAVTRDGATHVVRDWTASSGPQEVAGETSLPVGELSFITVGLVDGSAIVTAPIAQSPATPD
ncbi:zf-HC2 domain-containing protein [Micromonospora sp. HNM0581]|uniref:zf-HC2 domain-containing protein n=1 Tax=Micromonospora sp. HNM0581 TaxID=2716341 RepID=UPI00146B0720|nr:zf-HC2 domain-containing protein [Micromonospora sp. HNM0581]NLU77213.1 zf-HC2 domain-containing protein [Micromonospora sp. HNM0581]